MTLAKSRTWIAVPARKGISLLVLLVFLLPATALVQGNEFDLTRSSIDGGGAMRFVGGDYELSATIGQPDAGMLAGGEFQLSGGFWFPIPPGDGEDDGDVDLRDYLWWQACITGPDGLVATECRLFDLDGNGTVDLRDFAAVQKEFTGS